MFEELLAILAILAEGLRERCDEPDGRGVGGHDALVELPQREARRQRRHVEAGIVREPHADRLRGTRSMRRSLIALASLSVSPTMTCVDQMMPTFWGSRLRRAAPRPPPRAAWPSAGSACGRRRHGRRSAPPYACRGEPPAWMAQGRFAGRGYAERALHLEEASDMIARTLAGSATRPVSRFHSKASGSMLAHSARQTSMNSSMRS